MVKKTLFLAAFTVIFAACNTISEDEKTVQPEPTFAYGIQIDSLNLVQGEIKPGQAISSLFAQLGASAVAINQLNVVPKEVFDVRNVRAGKRYSAYYTQDSLPQLAYVVYHQSLVDHTVFQVKDTFAVRLFQKETRCETKTAHAVIKNSLWSAVTDNHLNVQLALDLSDIYAWSIDFFGLQANDEFTVYYDELFVDSVSVGIGKIHAAKFIHRKKPYYTYNFENEKVRGFWDENGNSVRKAFLKAPLKFSRISSGFTYARKHPVYKVVRPHTGVDYAAPAGTPVMTIGDGVVVQKGWKGGGGNTVKIRHNGTYSTAYLHLSKFANGLAVGSHVQQGQVIGYVGSTGASTGAHLDFRVWKNNSPINPLTMESPSVEPIPQKYLPEFFQLRDSLVQIIDSIR